MSLSADIRVDQGGFRLEAVLEVGAGEVVAVLGPNGSGKSTLLRTLAGLTGTMSGRIVLNDRVLDDSATGRRLPAADRRVGVVFQDFLLFPHLSALDNVAFGLRRRGMHRAEARQRALERLDRVGLAALARRKPRQLSGGQAQRVALARALAVRPELLLLDEPLASLDVGTRSEVRRDLGHELADFPGVAILVTHDPTEAFTLADRLVILESGRVVQSGTPAEVTARPRSPYVARFVGTNLLRGWAHHDRISLEGGLDLITPDAGSGDAFALIHPRTVAVHRARPSGSARNVWPGTVRCLDVERDVVRVDVTGKPPMVAEVTMDAVRDLGLAAGVEVWLSVKATEITVYPA